MSHSPATSSGNPAASYGSAGFGTPADTLIRASVTGALVGAAGAIAEAWPCLRSEGEPRKAAVRDVATTAGKVGLAVGLGALAANRLRGGPVVSAAVMVATGAAALRIMNTGKKSQSAPSTEPAAPTNEGETA